MQLGVVVINEGGGIVNAARRTTRWWCHRLSGSRGHRRGFGKLSDFTAIVSLHGLERQDIFEGIILRVTTTDVALCNTSSVVEIQGVWCTLSSMGTADVACFAMLIHFLPPHLSSHKGCFYFQNFFLPILYYYLILLSTFFICVIICVILCHKSSVKISFLKEIRITLNSKKTLLL